MSYPFVLGVYGFSDSGKTVLVTELIRRFGADGLHVGTIKCSHERFRFDTEGTDTFRYQEAGAFGSVFLSPMNTVLQLSTSIDELTGIALLTLHSKMDVILVEGANHAIIPKVRIGEIEKRENTVLTVDGPNVEKVYAYVKEHMHDQKTSSTLQLQVNGKHIPLSEFPEEIILKTLLGMLSSLHGVDAIESFQIAYS
jgi:molybdopterin-guanine dinucleotide biosynthesis protein B